MYNAGKLCNGYVVLAIIWFASIFTLAQVKADEAKLLGGGRYSSEDMRAEGISVETCPRLDFLIDHDDSEFRAAIYGYADGSKTPYDEGSMTRLKEGYGEKLVFRRGDCVITIDFEVSIPKE